MITLVAFLTVLLGLTMLAWWDEARRRRTAETRVKRSEDENDRIYGQLYEARRRLSDQASQLPTRGAQGRFAKRS